MKVRAVLDTNVVVSALIRPQGPGGAIWRRLAQGSFTAVFSLELLDEIAAVLGQRKIRTKYGVRPGDIEIIAGVFALRGELAVRGDRIRVCRDPGDDFLIETASAGKADFLVTGDEDLLTLKKHRRIRIVRPSAFIALLDKAGSKT